MYPSPNVCRRSQVKGEGVVHLVILRPSELEFSSLILSGSGVSASTHRRLPLNVKRLVSMPFYLLK